VGSNAQVKSMKRVAGTLKLDQAQYRELEAFSKFGSDLDAATLAVLNKGAKNVEILKQGLHSPMPVEKQIAIIYCGAKGLLKGIPASHVRDFEVEYLQFLEVKYPEILKKLKEGILDEETMSVLEKCSNEILEKHKI
jgi:F-type H+-transporting ATPase subunit alpha